MANPINPSAFFAEIQNRKNENEPQKQAAAVAAPAKPASKTTTKKTKKAEKDASTRQPYTIYLPEDIRDKLEEVRFKTKSTFSKLIEEALRQYFMLP